MNRRTRYILMAGVLVIGAAACGSDSKSAAGGATLEFTITDAGCDPFTVTAQPGPTSFHVRNTGAANITEFEVLDSTSRIIGEKENLTPGLDGSFSIDLKPGTYTLACPGGTQHATGTLTVSASTGSASGTADMDHDHSAAADGCVPSGSSASAATTVNATLSDFKIDLDHVTTPAGAVQIEGVNKGTHPHEIVVVKGVLSNELPTDANGAVDEDKLPPGASIGELEAFAPGNQCGASFDLTPGTYTLFCNVQGATEGAHFRLGMVTRLTVT